MDNLTLSWTKLTDIEGLIYPEENVCGIYLWGFMINNEFIPYYVGIADNIFYRIHEHINHIIGGLYVIYHRDSLGDFKEFKHQVVNPELSGGKIYFPNWPMGYKTFLKDRKKLQEHIDYMVDRFVFSFAELNLVSILKQDLKEVEKIVICQIGKENLQNTRSGASDRFKITHVGEKNVVKHMNVTKG